VATTDPAVGADARPTIDGVVFDFNGVLALDETLHYHAFRQTVQSTTGRRFGPDEYRSRCRGKSDSEALSALISSGYLVGDERALWGLKSAAYRTLLLGAVDDVVPAGTGRFLETLITSGVPFRVVTASTQDDVHAVLESTSLKYFVDIAMVTCHIPSHERGAAIANAAAQLNRSRSVLLVDDSERNILLGREEGLSTARMAEVGDEVSVADIVVSSLEQLNPFFRFKSPPSR